MIAMARLQPFFILMRQVALCLMTAQATPIRQPSQMARFLWAI